MSEKWRECEKAAAVHKPGKCLYFDDMIPQTEVKLQKLQEYLRECGRVAVALSGGVDSSVLMAVAHATLGADNALGVSVRSESLSAEECDMAAETAAARGWSHVMMPFDEFTVPEFAANPVDRCYYCKRGVFARVMQAAAARGITVIAEGTNADDTSDFRPGRRALEEMDIRSPLLDCGLTKFEVREIARRFMLANAEKPSNSCPATRFPVGTRLTPAGLRRVALAERALGELNLGQLRVRDHGDIARLELLPDRVPPAIADADTRARISAILHEAGYRFVCIDIDGYRTGNMNPV